MIQLRKLAIQYHERTEQYDRTVCTGPIQRGAILPANAREHALINRNAKAVMAELWPQARNLGFTRDQWWKAIQSMKG